ncbi:MAG: AMP-binding protein [Daejeonella sp.]|nr:AMP-binding protein [Daejeonella sp.]
MDILNFYSEVIRNIEKGELNSLSSLQLDKPDFFNWVEDIFYPMNVLKHGNSDALIWKYKNSKKVFSFEAIYKLSNQLVNYIRKHGGQKGDIIYSVLPLIPENWISILATIKGGFIIMPTATNLTVHDLLYRFNTLLPQIIIAHIDHADLIDEAEKKLGAQIGLKIIVGGQKYGWNSFEDIHDEERDASTVRTKSDDPFLYFFTSGTTGLPKIVVHTHFTYLFGHLTTSSWLGCQRGDIHYNISSPGWAKFAWSSFFAPWNCGTTIFANQTDSFIAKEQLEAMEEFKITTFCGSPTVIRMLIQEDISIYNLSLRSCCAAGEPLNPDVIDKWEKATGVAIRDGYGQTETTAMICNLPGNDLKPGSMGKPTFLYDIGIFDDDGNEVPALEEGVICVRLNTMKNNGLFIEYLNDKERTSLVFRHNLYYTGDKAYKDEEGYVWFVGRNDDIIKASGYRIGPFEVESALIEHEDIVEAAVIASPHPIRGYVVKAFIMLREGVSPGKMLADNIFSFAEKRLANYKVPRIIEFPDSLPKTISGKIRRIELRVNEAKHRLNPTDKEHEHFHKKY